MDESNKMEYRGYNIISDGAFSMAIIKQIGSGPVPKPLSGHFTSAEIAKQHVDAFLADTAKGKRRGKDTATNSG